MELSELTVRSFANLLGSDAPAPGGGSAAALESARGASLSAMVSALTIGRKKYEEYQDLAQQACTEASGLKDALLSAMEHDTDAFNDFGAAMAMPKDTPEQKAARSAAMQAALVECTESPYQIMVLTVRTLELADRLVGKTNANAMSDLGVSALSLGAGLRGAWLNVLINVGGIKDEAIANHFRADGKALLEKGMALSDSIYQRIENALE